MANIYKRKLESNQQRNNASGPSFLWVTHFYHKNGEHIELFVLIMPKYSE